MVQAGSTPFDTPTYVAKTVRLTQQAAAQGAKVILFPQAFIAGYPKGLNYGLMVGARDPLGREEFRPYLDAAIEVPGMETAQLGEAAAANNCHLVIGVIERDGGFYDRMLATLAPRPITVGLGYAPGFLPDFEPEPHDRLAAAASTSSLLTQALTT